MFGPYRGVCKERELERAYTTRLRSTSSPPLPDCLGVPEQFPNAEKACEQVMSLPFYSGLGDGVDRVFSELRRDVAANRRIATRDCP